MADVRDWHLCRDLPRMLRHPYIYSRQFLPVGPFRNCEKISEVDHRLKTVVCSIMSYCIVETMVDSNFGVRFFIKNQ